MKLLHRVSRVFLMLVCALLWSPGWANSPPFATDDYFSAFVGYPVTIDVLINDADADGDPLIVVAVSPPSLGTAVINLGGTVTYTPSIPGNDNFSYTITDGLGGTDTATVTIVVGVPPDISVSPDSLSATLQPDTTTVLTVTATNSGGSDLNFSITEADGSCTSLTDISWLTTNPTSGVIPPGGSLPVTVTVDATGVDPGDYSASVCITSNDPASPVVPVLVSLTVEAPPPIAVPVDIRPGSCPNPLNCKAKGVLPVAIAGTAELDVTQIDPVTIRLAGVAPLGSDIEDVTTPFEPFTGKQDCDIDCNTVSPDGFPDLTLKFDLQEVIAALGNAVQDGACLVVELTGNLREEAGGTAIVGEDVMRILCKRGQK